MAKICNINFWIGNDPPLLELFQKFIRFGSAALPIYASINPIPGLLKSVKYPLVPRHEMKVQEMHISENSLRALQMHFKCASFHNIPSLNGIKFISLHTFVAVFDNITETLSIPTQQ